MVHFSAASCGPCPALCTTGKRRRLTLPPRDLAEAQAATRAAEKTIPFQADYARRAGVEGTMHQAASHARYRGLPRTRLDHVYMACALNLLRLHAYWTGTPLDRRRTSRRRIELLDGLGDIDVLGAHVAWDIGMLVAVGSEHDRTMRSEVPRLCDADGERPRLVAAAGRRVEKKDGAAQRGQPDGRNTGKGGDVIGPRACGVDWGAGAELGATEPDRPPYGLPFQGVDPGVKQHGAAIRPRPPEHLLVQQVDVDGLRLRLE